MFTDSQIEEVLEAAYEAASGMIDPNLGALAMDLVFSGDFDSYGMGYEELFDILEEHTDYPA